MPNGLRNLIVPMAGFRAEFVVMFQRAIAQFLYRGLLRVSLHRRPHPILGLGGHFASSAHFLMLATLLAGILSGDLMPGAASLVSNRPLISFISTTISIAFSSASEI